MKVLLFACYQVLSSLVSGPATDHEVDRWTIGGYADAYIGWSSPRQGAGLTRSGRTFDVRNEQFRLAAAQIDFNYKDDSGHFGATISPWFGDNADILWQAEPTETQLAKHLAQAYVTFSSGDGKLAADIGKFYAWVGYESTESLDNDLYSGGLVYTFAQPSYHLGLRLNSELTPQLGASLFFTNGWNQMERDTSGVTAGAQLRYSADEKTSVSVGVITGREGGDTANRGGTYGGIAYGAPGSVQTDMVDLVVTHQATEKLKLALNADYASAHGDGMSGNWAGVAGYARYQCSNRLGFGARLETFRDDGGLRLGESASLSSFTLGADYWLQPNMILRGELRKDWSNVALFDSQNGPRKHQGTLNLSLGVKF